MGLCLVGNASLTGQEGVGTFSKGEAEQQTGSREKSRPAQGASKGFGKLCISDGGRADDVEGSFKAVIIESPQDQGHTILQVDPWHELPTGAEGSSQPCAEHGGELFQGPTPAAALRACGLCVAGRT